MSYEKQYYRVIDAMLLPGSEADKRHRAAAAEFRRAKTRSSVLIGRDDLIKQGGQVLPQSLFRNIFLGGDEVWGPTDPSLIDGAIKRALTDRRLENVMRQYFEGSSISCDGQDPEFPLWTPQPEVGREDVDAILTNLFQENPKLVRDLDATLFNIILPRGVVLRSGQSTSRIGLGGFHGSTSLRIGNQRQSVYFSLNVFSEQTPEDGRNGIPVFDQPWKNIVATLYHEINEFRTDPDVEKANSAETEEEALELIGWISRANEEVGDHPLSGSHALSEVFQEVLLADESRRVPVQFMYSNALHDAQGPVDNPSVIEGENVA